MTTMTFRSSTEPPENEYERKRLRELDEALAALQLPPFTCVVCCRVAVARCM